jgi:ABC-type Fe3+-hydroxamate transport system substrate-binding protein
MKFTDQIGYRIEIKATPKRIISIVPSQSEFLWNIGLRDELVGISKFCIHPHELFKTVERVGGTKDLNLEKIRALKPDIIIGNKEENERSQIEILQKEFPVWMSDIYNFEDAFAMMKQLGELVGKEAQTKVIVDSITQHLPEIKNTFSGQSVAYFIWNEPYMFAAKNTFIDFVLSYIGFKNVLESTERYPCMNEQELKKLNPDYCFLSSEPYPFKERHIQKLKKILPDSKICLVDGELFSWYGSRLQKLPQYSKQLKKDLKIVEK